MSLVSSIKPGSESNADKIEPKFEYNDATYQSYIKEGFEEWIPHGVQAPHDRLQEFIAAVQDRPVRETVTYIERLRPAENGFKDVLIYRKDIEGNAWAGNRVNPVIGHLMGIHKRQTREPRINEKKEIIEYIKGNEVTEYTIPYTKEKLDEILAIGDTNKDMVKFEIKNPRGAQKAYFSYEQFIKPWNECINMLLTPGGPEAVYIQDLVSSSNNTSSSKAQVSRQVKI